MSTWYRRAARKVWPDLPVKPTPEEIQETNALPERRRVPYAKVSDLHQLRNRTMVSLLVVALASSFAVWRVVDESKHADLSSCINAGKFRILTAQSNDKLRRAAVGLVPGQEANPRVQRFLVATQPAIDDLLTRAAGRPMRALGNGGEVDADTVRAAERMSQQRCERRVNGITEPEGP